MARFFAIGQALADTQRTSTDGHHDEHQLEEDALSQFGDVVRALRKERGLTMEALARKTGTHKGYISGIESGGVPPPSVRLIRKFAKALGQDERRLVRIGWVDKAPEIIREEALRFLEWVEAGMPRGR